MSQDYQSYDDFEREREALAQDLGRRIARRGLGRTMLYFGQLGYVGTFVLPVSSSPQLERSGESPSSLASL